MRHAREGGFVIRKLEGKWSGRDCWCYMRLGLGLGGWNKCRTIKKGGAYPLWCRGQRWSACGNRNSGLLIYNGHKAVSVRKKRRNKEEMEKARREEEVAVGSLTYGAAPTMSRSEWEEITDGIFSAGDR